jgi:hypothetical protein
MIAASISFCCESNPPIIPVSTSPVPNFASEGFPVVFINASPAGLKIIVG